MLIWCLHSDEMLASPLQAYCDGVYSRVMWTLLFGRAGWEAIRPHLSSFKANTIKVCETTGFHGENVFHMHLDGKIGLVQANNQAQKKTIRLLFSIVRGAENAGNVSTTKVQGGGGSASVVHGCTVYPVWQYRAGFRNNAEFHRYMTGRYRECGPSTGLPRSLYVIPEPLVYRAISGEVLVHKSHADAHGPQPIHAEANPCPDRYLFVFDFANIITRTVDKWGKAGPTSVKIPEAAILDQIRALTDCSAAAFQQRLADVAEVAEELLSGEADKYPDGHAAVEGVLRAVNELAATHDR